MGKIDKFTEQKIKDAADIVDVVSDFLELRRKGANYETLCPFHNDRHLGSFVVNPRHNCYKCFSCDAKGGPVDFLINYAKMEYPDALRYLAQKYSIHIEEEDEPKFKNVKPAKPRSLEDRIPADLPPALWPVEWVGYYTNVDKDNLVNWLRRQPWDSVQRKNLERALSDYHIGHTSFEWKGEQHDFTIFWQIDENNVLHNGHLMKYMPTGKRDKESDYAQTWLHARMKYATNHPLRFNDKEKAASYCLFGLHLLNAYPNATINIAESEKTIVIMAAAYGNHGAQVWMACGGIENINKERLKPLIDQGRKIVLYPDRDGIDKWKKKAEALEYSRVSLNTDLVKKWWMPEDGETADCADVVLRFVRNNRPQPVGEVLRKAIADNPALASLNEKFGLEILEKDGE